MTGMWSTCEWRLLTERRRIRRAFARVNPPPAGAPGAAWATDPAVYARLQKIHRDES